MSADTVHLVETLARVIVITSTTVALLALTIGPLLEWDARRRAARVDRHRRLRHRIIEATGNGYLPADAWDREEAA